MTYESLLLIIFGVIILVLLFVVYIMYVRIQQLLREFDQMESRMKVTDSEIEALARNVEEIKKLKI
jgi:predicted Holliday junction resolvase-like endonuclease